KRDARTIARLLRTGDLTAVYVPEPTDEAIRDLCRSRTDAIDDQRRCRFRLKAFLLRHGYRYQGKANWSQPHMRYLRELVLPHPATASRFVLPSPILMAASTPPFLNDSNLASPNRIWPLLPCISLVQPFERNSSAYSACSAVSLLLVPALPPCVSAVKLAFVT